MHINFGLMGEEEGGYISDLVLIIHKHKISLESFLIITLYTSNVCLSVCVASYRSRKGFD